MQVEDIMMDGHPVPVLIQNEDTGVFDLDEEALQEVLLNPKIADKYVCVLAVAGAFRKGKSFLLDFLLRYMSSQVRFV
ncbi:atlastin-2-like isoform X2 [Penaeus japonicus]|uniref:atlastin-2-like isoform X2 n=1 Tax=Penaeus japonicus TaxID=27405 RepID=UPI001C70DADA|nr:atlastin-2-like isoform X2 [Penaeus japonicus]XP_042893783.1 atlastin-2-like isoform X2 [Penaeus japonicus]XP_042893784.1 atlastin-2-like isoform X2 [Penaeus japonicus]XP_042893785.1 atlastin-2-like isoform X2 [Penaeus japonicus]